MKEKTIIGKDVLESLTTSMYDDARFVYREYIQNSADAIDKARLQKFVKEENIYITINADKRRIEIEDDAIGVEVVNVSKYLKNIAVSHKRKGVDKGFRGIGRLGGLGYCDKLIFETSAQSETVKSIMTWDAKKLKEIIADRTQKEEASTVIDRVTTLKQENEIADKHYFKVILEGVTNDILLDVKDIRQYLSMVAPVPFKKSIFSDKIYDKLKKENIEIDEYNIFVNTEQLFKGYNWYIYEGDQNNKRKIIGEIFEIEFFSEKNRNGENLFWGWYGIAEKNETLNKINYSRGFRLRKANIQIGNDDTLQRLQKENRFQFYFFGEVYALHPDLHPNARRDYFSENEICKEFDSKLKEFFYKTIAPLCQDSSTTNASIKKIENYHNLLAEYQHKDEKGFINKDEKANLESEIEKKKKDAETATKKIENLKSKENSPISKIIERRTSNVNIKVKETEIETPSKPTFRTDKLSKLEKRDRKFLGEIFTIINDVLTKDLAENLIQKIEEKYK